MSIKKDKMLHLLCFVLLVTLTGVKLSADEKAGDPVLEYYVNRSAAVFKSTSPMISGTSFSFVGTTYYKTIGNEGKVKKTDSAAIKYFYSFGQLDSSRLIYETAQKFGDLDFTVPDIFEFDYDLYFFPNDTGGEQMALGFDGDTAAHEAPTGLLLIDRNNFQIRWLYLHYPERKNYKRYSRCFRFIEYKGRVFPDSIWEVGARLGVFSTDDYRAETRVDSLEIY